MKSASLRPPAGNTSRLARVSFLRLVSVFLLLSPVLHAQWKNLPQKKTLKNGLVIVSQTDGSSTVTVLELVIGGGKKAEPTGLEGLAYLTTRLALEIPDQAKIQELMEKATRYMITSRGDWSVIHIECLSENLDPTLRIVLKILKDPLFSGIRIDRNKESMTNARKIEHDDNINVGHLAQIEAFFRGTGYAGSIYGDAESLSRIRGRDIQDFYKVRFAPENMVLVAISDLEPALLAAELEKHFGSLPPGKETRTASLEERPLLPADLQETTVVKATQQALVSAGFLLPGPSPRDYARAMILENLLGRGPGSRLWTLRMDQKLAYNVNALASFMKDGGILEAYLETDASKRDLARDALAKALGRLTEGGIEAEELAETKAVTRANYLRTNETKERRASTLGFFEAMGLGVDFFARFPAELESVTLEDMNAYIREFVRPEKMKLVVVGPEK